MLRERRTGRGGRRRWADGCWMDCCWMDWCWMDWCWRDRCASPAPCIPHERIGNTPYLIVQVRRVKRNSGQTAKHHSPRTTVRYVAQSYEAQLCESGSNRRTSSTSSPTSAKSALTTRLGQLRTRVISPSSSE
ncbi:hypothetical protein CALVIDRAFT_46527 [Calocera viscosa TUFC12733]|uniref:Uncharacterized protein n=1 Tax=Calocera viscosa (strain TUFC12733) TaxID=1330018 RepID=A0A167FLT5_CALVF|nr:hypothetical protein CALVIDRAFT_46527 [Calocera viscosa TUFC12733]